MASRLKLLVVHPGPLLYTNVFLRLEPLGLELVAAAARNAGHAVRLLDLQVETHRDYHRVIADWQPEVIAFSCNYLANVPEIVDLAKATKAAHPHIFIAVGGHSASFTARAISSAIAANISSASSTPARRLNSPAAARGIARSAAPGPFTAAATGW